jgi:hypothetical protein
MFWRTAELMVSHYGGARAASEARRHYRRVLDRGDVDGWHVWARIRLAIDSLQASVSGEPN